MTQPVKCECGALFGIEQDDGSLAIKYRDLFRLVKGSVSGPCRKCGAIVNWPSVPYTIPFTVSGGWSSGPWQWRPVTSSPTYTCNCACERCLAGDCCMMPPT